MTATERIQAQLIVAALRGLYGDIADYLDDPAECNDLLLQIEEQQRLFAELVAAPS